MISWDVGSSYSAMVTAHIDKNGVIVIDEILRREEVRKEMAIDYRKEWKKFQAKCGNYYIVKDPGSAITPTHTVKNEMDTQIRNTILERERLMNEYIHEKMQTNIDGGTKLAHNVDIILNGVLSARVSINKKHFAEWCERKKKRKEV